MIFLRSFGLVTKIIESCVADVPFVITDSSSFHHDVVECIIPSICSSDTMAVSNAIFPCRMENVAHIGKSCAFAFGPSTVEAHLLSNTFVSTRRMPLLSKINLSPLGRYFGKLQLKNNWGNLTPPRSLQHLGYSMSNDAEDSCYGASPFELSSGTTSLLAVIQDVSPPKVHSWVGGWLQNRVFSADPLPVPVSVDLASVCNSAVLLFYGSDGLVRGSLEFNTTSYESELNAAMLRITSRSRFVNPAGLMSASIPGERRIVRNMFAALQTKFGPDNCRVMYKVRRCIW
jgi:hypothetical protein